MNADYFWIYITTGSRSEAVDLSKALVSERLASCANIIDGATSLYWWGGKIQESKETVIVAKTKAGLVETLIERVKELHSYECPCVAALPIVAGNQPFLDWIGAETRPLASAKDSR